MWDKLNFTDGAKGTEGGIIICDEEYRETCRITIEKCPRYLAITCGVYGAMVHTVFCDVENSIFTYEAMKKDLAEFSDRTTTWDEECDFYDYFTSKY